MKNYTAGGKQFTLYSITGIVEDSQKSSTMQVSGGGGGSYGNGHSAPVHITSKTTIHDQLFVKDAAGVEHAFQLSDFNIAARTGNSVTVLWAVKAGKDSGEYIAVLNQTTQQNFFDSGVITKMHRDRKNIFIAFAIFLGIFIFNKLWYIFIIALIGFIIFKKREIKKLVQEFKTNIHQYI